MEETFTLSFRNKIGKTVTLSDSGEYYCGEYISCRFYSGVFGGSFERSDGIYFMVDKDCIKVGINTNITFSL